MMAWILSFTLSTVGFWLPSDPMGQSGPNHFQDLDDELSKALQVIVEKDEVFGKRLMDALKEGDRALEDRALEEEILRHAAYIREMERLRKEEPRKYKMLRKQEALEEKVKATIARWEQGKRSHRDRRETTKRLNPLLDEWFELRQRIREYDVSQMEDMIRREKEEFEEVRVMHKELRGRWFYRVIDGGEEAMRERLGTLSEPNPDQWAPRLHHHLYERDQPLASRLEALAGRNYGKYLQAMAKLAEEHEEVFEEVMNDLSEEPGFVHDQNFRKCQVRALESFLADPESWQSDQPRLTQPQSQALDQVVEAEILLTEYHLDKMEERAQREREYLKIRGESKETIIAVQRVQLMNEHDLLEW